VTIEIDLELIANINSMLERLTNTPRYLDVCESWWNLAREPDFYSNLRNAV